MKRFRYGLESLMRLRRAHLDQELAQLERISSAITQTERSRAELDQTNLESCRLAAASAALEGWQLAALHEFRRFAAAEDRRLAHVQDQLTRRRDAQHRRVIEAHKSVRILEMLKEKRLAAWKAELDREQEKSVAELAVARWKARRED